MTNEEKILELLGQLQTDMTAMKTDMTAMKTDMAAMKEQINVIDDRSQRTAVLLETEVDRKLKILYEGHSAIMEQLDKLASKSRVEMLESDVELLKQAFKLMRQEIAELKKAQ